MTFAATGWEYRHRYLIHGAIYVAGLAAPWQLPVWGYLHNGSSWFLLADALSKPSYERFAATWNTICAAILVCAVLGAWLRTWGAAYLGATTVHRGGMEGDRMVASGPYRYVRNPLYLGTILHSVAICMLMRPAPAVVCFILLILLQLRLIFREEPYLRTTLGPAYDAYCAQVPRLLPRLRPVADGGARPHWGQGTLSEIYMIGVAVTFAAVGWTQGFAWETSIVHVTQGVVMSLGLSVMARAFIPKAQF